LGAHSNPGLFSIHLHEFFHAVEALTQLPTTHGFLDQNRRAYPGWKGQGQNDYFWWQFREGIPPRIGGDWTRLSFLNQYPSSQNHSLLAKNRSVKRLVGPLRLKQAYDQLLAGERLQDQRRLTA